MRKVALWFVGWGLAISLSAQTIIFQEGFGGVTPGNIPAQWYLGDGGVVDLVPPLHHDSTWTVDSNYNGNTLGQGNFLFIRYNCSLGQQDTIITDTFDATGVTGSVYLGYLTYYWAGSSDTGFVQVYDGATWQTVKMYTGSTVGGWGTNAQWEMIDVTPYANANMMVRFVWHENCDWYWAIDSVTVFSACLAPINVQISPICPDSIAISWAAYGGDSVVVEYGAPGFTPGTGTRFQVAGTDTQFYAGPGVYEVRVWGYCGSNASFDTVVQSVYVGNMPVNVSVYTSSFPQEVYWKLFHIPDSSLVASVTAGYYSSSNPTDTHVVCMVHGDTFRFEAWDSYGDGWNGGLYEIWVNTSCGRLILANNGGSTPTNNVNAGGNDDLESVEYFVVDTTTLSPVENVVATPISDTSIVVTWTAASDTVYIEYGVAGFTPGTGTVHAIPFPTATDTLQPLTPNTTYDIYVWRVCNGLVSDTVLVSATTFCTPFTLPFLETFETTGPDSIPSCWVADPTFGPDTVGVDTLSSCVMGQGSLSIYGGSGSGFAAITPYLDVSSYAGLIVKYYYREGDNTSCGNDPESSDSLFVELWDGSSWQVIAAYSGAANITTYTPAQHIVPIAGWGLTTTQVRFRAKGTGAGFDNWYIDSVEIIGVTCLAPTGVVAQWVTIDSIRVAWAFNIGDSVRVEYGAPGFTPGSGTSLIVVAPDTSVTFYVAPGSYDIYVWSYCGGNASLDTVLVSLCGPPITLPYIENFTDTALWSNTCWSRNNTQYVYVDTTMDCSFSGNVLTLWGQAGLEAVSPDFIVTPGQPIKISYYYRAGGGSCGETPDANDRVAVQYWDGSQWQNLVVYDGGNEGPVWKPATHFVCLPPGVSSTKIRFYMVSGSGSSFDSWHFDSLRIELAPTQPDIEIVGIDLIEHTLCGVGSADTLVVAYVNYGGGAADTVEIGYQVGATVFTDTVIYASGFGSCNDAGNIDTVFLPLNLTGTGAFTVVVWAEDIYEEGDLSDSVTFIRSVGDRWVYLGLTTASFGNEVYWKLFHIPDSVLVASVPPATYSSNNSYVDSFCLLTGDTYRYEAWDSWGDGWHGGGFKIYTFNNCGDTVYYVPFTPVPNNAGNLEVVSYFTVDDPNVPTNVALVDVLAPQPTSVCNTAIQDSVKVVFKNNGTLPLDTVYVGFELLGNVVQDTIVYSPPLAPCALDTYMIDTFSLINAAANIYIWARGSIDSVSSDDSASVPLSSGNRWVYLGIATQSWGYEIFWKLFYMPDSVLVASVPAGTYSSNSSSVDSVCLIDGATYRFEAWDDFGDGWNGGTYRWYLLLCGDTVVLADNGGQTPSNGTCCGVQLESVEYFTVAANDVQAELFLQPDTSNCIAKPIDVAMVVTNYTESPITADVYLTFTPVGLGTLKDTTLTAYAIDPCTDTIWATLYNIDVGAYAVHGIVSYSGDVNPANDTVFTDTVRILDSLPTPPLPPVAEACADETPVTLDATISGFTPVHYSWWPSGDTASAIDVNATGLYVVTITYGSGCVLVDTAQVIVYPAPSVSIMGPAVVDQGVPNTYTVVPPAPADTAYYYQWNTGDTTATITYTATQPGQDTLWVIVTNIYGCDDTAVKIIEVITGVDQAQANAYVLRYYPTTATAQIVAGQDVIEWVEVRDVVGRVLTRRSVNDQVVTVSLKRLPAGTYFIAVKGRKAGLVVYRVLKEE